MCGRKLWRQATTLVELTLTLALAAIVIFVGIRAYAGARENSRMHQLVEEIGRVRAAVAPG